MKKVFIALSLFAAVAMTSCSDKANDPQPKQEQVTPVAQTGTLKINLESAENQRADFSDVKTVTFKIDKKEYTMPIDKLLVLKVGAHTLTDFNFTSHGVKFTQNEAQDFTISADLTTNLTIKVTPEVTNTEQFGGLGLNVVTDFAKALETHDYVQFVSKDATTSKVASKVYPSLGLVVRVMNSSATTQRLVITKGGIQEFSGEINGNSEGYVKIANAKDKDNLIVTLNEVAI
ncbi:hypothetical protein [Persicobacter psychrovividus]|uniref:DUF4382 domain-containing protein n=1 Tax=Persicobacter psychrovividus TaxID=387638 RepID=A0ABN6LCE8_9BACT|nr:hypothetical protein PEPS_31390 [Persicobacter psychrovividus]